MKKIVLILIFLPLIGFSQEIVVNQLGEKVILNIDGTWELFELEELNIPDGDRGVHFMSNHFTCISNTLNKKYENTNYLDLLSNPTKFLSSYRNEFDEKNFDVNSHEILEYDNENDDFLLIDKNGNTGFHSNYCDNVKSGIGRDTLFHSESDLRSYFNKRNRLRRIDHDIDHPIEIQSATVFSINSAGGVDLTLDWHYLDNNNDIKYIDVTFVPYNAVGDIVSGSYNGSREIIRQTGPIEAGHYTPTWSNVWYNYSICCIKVVKVSVTYMDGSNYTYVNELDKISSPFLKYYCFE
ncbi:MAG: hypothetical protein ACKVG7_02275 [Flavobacteriales bacterium]